MLHAFGSWGWGGEAVAKDFAAAIQKDNLRFRDPLGLGHAGRDMRGGQSTAKGKTSYYRKEKPLPRS
jgi:hypothetical protein